SEAESARVRTADMAQAGRNPGRIIGTVLTAFVREHAGQRVRVIGEPIWAGRSEDEYPACAEHEALINVALGEAPAYILCPYDVRRLDREWLTDATRTHPTLAAYGDQPPEPAPPEADVLVIGPTTGPSTARRFVHDYAQATGMSEGRLRNLRTAVQELVVNTVVHAGGSGILMIWTHGRQVVCQVQDGGRITDPL